MPEKTPGSGGSTSTVEVVSWAPPWPDSSLGMLQVGNSGGGTSTFSSTFETSVEVSSWVGPWPDTSLGTLSEPDRMLNTSFLPSLTQASRGFSSMSDRNSESTAVGSPQKGR